MLWLWCWVVAVAAAVQPYTSVCRPVAWDTAMFYFDSKFRHIYLMGDCLNDPVEDCSTVIPFTTKEGTSTLDYRTVTADRFFAARSTKRMELYWCAEEEEILPWCGTTECLRVTCQPKNYYDLSYVYRGLYYHLFRYNYATVRDQQVNYMVSARDHNPQDLNLYFPTNDTTFVMLRYGSMEYSYLCNLDPSSVVPAATEPVPVPALTSTATTTTKTTPTTTRPTTRPTTKTAAATTRTERSTTGTEPRPSVAQERTQGSWAWLYVLLFATLLAACVAATVWLHRRHRPAFLSLPRDDDDNDVEVVYTARSSERPVVTVTVSL